MVAYPDLGPRPSIGCGWKTCHSSGSILWATISISAIDPATLGKDFEAMLGTAKLPVDWNLAMIFGVTLTAVMGVTSLAPAFLKSRRCLV